MSEFFSESAEQYAHAESGRGRKVDNYLKQLAEFNQKDLNKVRSNMSTQDLIKN